jgi:DNA-binding transcriptional MerR regulator
MPKLKSEVPKLYYTIGEVADMLGVSRSLIRFWETEFDQLKPAKNSKGERRFTQKNIDVLRQIHYLVKERGFTLEGAKRETQLRKNQPLDEQNMLNRLLMIRQGLSTLRDKLDQ